MIYIFTNRLSHNIYWFEKMLKKYSLFGIIFLLGTINTFAQSYSGGGGTSGNPYLISNKADLKYLSENSSEWSKYFKQTTDITFDDADFQSGGDFYNSGSQFIPIGNNSVNFTGSYDGDNYKITNLKINRGSTDYVGFFGRVSGSNIQNLCIENSNIKGNQYVGGLAGFSSVTITNCCVVASLIDGSTEAGGLVGRNEMRIEKCYSTGSVIGGNRLGGLVGTQSATGTTAHSYSSAAVDDYASQDIYGGLMGDNSGGSVAYCYAIGDMTGANNNARGGLVGTNGGVIWPSFWDTQTSGTSTGVGSGVTSSASGKTTAEMKTQSTFTDWNFTTIWQIVGGDGANYPDLISNSNSALPVELTSFTAFLSENTATLNWQTATEVNNYGFEVERQKTEISSRNSVEKNNEWEKIGFVNGHGNSNSPKFYTFIDNSNLSGSYSYRLKQIDFDGKFEYSDVVNISFSNTSEFSLSQNYPNPFNPTTKISFTIPSSENDLSAFTTLKVYDILGREVRTLVNEKKSAGHYEVDFNASKLSSGIYFYTLSTGKFQQTKKMLIIK